MQADGKPTTRVIIDEQPFNLTPAEVLDLVYDALQAKGYNASLQLSGYLSTGDPTYITSFNNARNLITRFERDEFLYVLINDYVRSREGK